ncbi:PAS domain S-box protein [Tumidithrix elongata RA019]|uniref:Circadian input-output histidine kinase CikA n=1 Tax=Tumidithrix elongata BACA0141 TaxID=2716417 RepID=A0AAW9PWU5_9CYAN|nr:PAS domain S-box protein [Tumidithrix elongata RA019]
MYYFQTSLLNRICEIAIADGGFRLAWVGIVNPDNQMVEIAAVAGEAIEYVKNIQISIDPALPIAYGPTGIAIREKYPVIVNDYLADSRTVSWHSIAIAHGIQSNVTIPLRIDRETIGAIMFYASEVNYFADDVIALLNELAEDLAMSLALADSEKRRKAAEKEIREQAFLFQSQFDAGVLGIAISSVQQQWLRVNRKLSEMLGYSETELCGMSWVEMTYPQDLAANLEKFQRLIDGEIDGYELEKRFIRKDGSLAYTHMNVSCYRAEDRSVQFLVSSFQDITSRKQAERALQQSEERFRLAIINAPFPIIFYTKDNKVLEINRAWIDQAGYAESDIQEITAWTDRFCLESLPFLNPQTAAWQTNDRHEQEIAITARDGSQRIWRFGSALLPYPFESNNFTAISMAIDVTEQRRAELELKLSEERFRRAIVNAPLPTIIHAEGGEVLQLNQAWSEISGYSLEDIPTISAWVKKVYGENPASVLTTIEQIYEINDIRHEGEFTITVRDGSTRIWDFHSAPLGRIADGRRIIISMAIDVSDRKANELALQKAKELAEEANRAKSTFLANMSHELRTPLNGILGYTQIFLLDSGFTAKQKEGLQIIYQCGNHLLDLISEILDLSKIEAQKLELLPKSIEFSRFLIGVAQICRIKAEEKNLIFNYEVSDNLPLSVLVDDQRLRQVLLNLLGNAIKFTDRGSVTMKVEAIEAWESKDLEPLESFHRSQISQPNSIAKIRFEIADTGKGIASQNLEQIFQPFEQVGDRQNRPEGTGLGLAISQKLVAMMGGSLSVESQLNLGSRFWFDLELPEITATIAAQTGSIPTSIKSDRVIGYRGQKRTILVVDDQWINRSVLSKMLESWGFKVLEAANGEQGITMATSNPIDAILTDLIMPVLDGYAMTQKLRELPTFQKLPIIAISASILPIEQIKSQEAGCTDFLPKPVDTTALLEKLKQYLHLDWIYAKSLSDTRSPDIKFDQTPSDRKIPPVQELITIQEALEVGDFQAIEQEAERIKRLDPQYQWFSVRLVELTQSFDEKGILQLIN